MALPQRHHRCAENNHFEVTYIVYTKKANRDISQQTAMSGAESPTVGQANGESVPAGAAATVVTPGKHVLSFLLFPLTDRGVDRI